MNINSDIEFFKKIDIKKGNDFSLLLTELRFEPFRHIPKLQINFENPISIIAGTNRSGKSTILMALACSHYNFQKRNAKNGKLERQTWSSLMKFTSHDIQKADWTYYISNQIDGFTETKRGQRKKSTNKWNGIGKKESQFKRRQVIFIDIDRIVPARFYNDKIYALSRKATLQEISTNKVNDIEKYLSYVLEEKFEIKKLVQYLDKDVYKYSNTNQYSSYNAASGEEVLTRIIIDIVEASKNALILIDEIEMGLHPKIQRRLLDVIRNISRREKKQFIITTHSGTILDSVTCSSRIFIEKGYSEEYKTIHNISVHAALSKMDSKSFPLVDLYCEDDLSKRIIQKGLTEIENEKEIKSFSDLINIIVSGSANKTYQNFISHKNTYEFKKVKSGYACVLDGDMKDIKNANQVVLYPQEENLHFLFSDECPEKFLTKAYLNKHPNPTIKYYLESQNPHCLLKIIKENSSFNEIIEVIDECWSIVVQSIKGREYFESLKSFLIKIAKKYSPEL